MTICIVIGSITIIVYISVSHLFQSKVTVVNSKLDPRLLKFLEEADEAYMRSYKNSRLEIFADYATAELCELLYEEMEQGEKKLFGTESSRKREWYLLKEEGCLYTVKKILTHSKIKQKTVSITLGDCIEETWKVSSMNKSFKVCDIL